MRKKIALLAVVTATLTGCGMLPGQQQAGGGQEKQQAAEQTAKKQEPKETETPTASATPQEAEAVEAIASRKVSHDGSSLRVDITGLKRQGKVATLTWTVSNLDSGSSDWYVGSNLGTRTLDYTVAAVSLIDPVNAKRYRVARNGTGEDAECVCSSVKGERVEAGASLEMYAVYGAPPEDVTKVNVELPDLGVFTDVPIS